MDKKTIKQITDFIYECGILSKTPRSGLWFLGTGNQSVAEHSLRTAFIGYALCSLTPKADKNKVVLMCILHDLGEGRTSDLNYVHQKYGRLAESKAVKDIARNVPFGKDLLNHYNEVEKKVTIEAKLAKDADQLEWITTLREEEAKGNVKAKSWTYNAYKRLKTPAAKIIGRSILKTHPDRWWFDEKDKWFVSRKKQDKNWK